MAEKNFISTTQCTKVFVDDIYSQLKILSVEYSSHTFKKKLSTLGSGLQANLYFDQPSTRTYYSFFHALSQLGMNVSSFQPNEMTSTKKGESRLDTLHTLANYIDLQVIRTESSSLVDQTLELYQNYNVSTRLINAGSHQIEHPTQALLDILTILEHCEKNQRNLGEMKFLIVGDIERGRAAKSFLQIIKQYGATKIDICEHSNQTENLSSNQHKFREFSSQADYIYMTRVQNEYGGF